MNPSRAKEHLETLPWVRSAVVERCLAEAVRWIDAANAQALDDPTGTRPAWGDWPERAEHPLLLREAQMLVNKHLVE